VLLAETRASPDSIERRVAFSRRVGVYIPEGEIGEVELAELRSTSYRVGVFGPKKDERDTVSRLAVKIGGVVSLDSPAYEVTVFQGERSYLGITRPSSMRQGWSTRRPRIRAFFHPSAIFPKLSRALVNFSGVQEGEVFLDPFCGTGSLLIEASVIGVEPVGMDLARKMVRGAKRNAAQLGQEWLGIVRSDARRFPLRRADAIATDVPYGRASSTGGRDTSSILSELIANAGDVLPRGRRLVVMHPESLPLDPGGLFRAEQEHRFYVHHKLTRAITVLRRE